MLPGCAPGGWQEGARIRVPKPGGHRRLPRLLRLPSALGSQTQGSGAPMTRALSPRLTLPRVSTKLQVGQGRSVRGQAGKAGRPTAATGWTGRAQDGGGLPTEARTGCSRRLWGRRRTGGQGGAGGCPTSRTWAGDPCRLLIYAGSCFPRPLLLAAQVKHPPSRKARKPRPGLYPFPQQVLKLHGHIWRVGNRSPPPGNLSTCFVFTQVEKRSFSNFSL